MRTVQLLAISHQTADLSVRELFHFTEKEKIQFTQQAQTNFGIEGMLLLATCNRTEIYFEAEHLSTETLLDNLLIFKGLDKKDFLTDHFLHFTNTTAVAQYLLEVSSGLRSLVIGDMQIISQVKQAYQESQTLNAQGHLLERIIQAVFKMHKRIQNETNFRDGSASSSYLALQAASQFFGKKNLADKKLLLVGAGEIMRDVAKYTTKFEFKNIKIINRTLAKAEKIAAEYGFQIGDWADLNDEILKADVVISGVSNAPQLIKNRPVFNGSTDSKLFIDLGMPANIDKKLEQQSHFKVIDIDHLSTKIQQVEAQRQQAAEKVEAIIEQELEIFQAWLSKVPVNRSINKLKQHVQALLEKEMNTLFANLSESERQHFAQRLSQQIVKQPAVFLHQQSENPQYREALEAVFAL